MDGPTSAQGEQLLRLASQFSEIFGSRAAKHEGAGTFPFENYEDLRQSGYLLATIPTEFGGWGCTLEEVVRAQARLGEGCASTALVVTMHLIQVARAVQLGNWPRAKLVDTLKYMVETGAMLNSAASEPATGSPSRGGMPTTTARLDPETGDWIINGRKTYTTGSPVVHFFAISAAVQRKQPGGETKVEAGNFLIPRDTPGLQVIETWNSLAMRLSGSHDLKLEEVRVPAENYLGANQKSSPFQQALNAAWGLPVAAIYLGNGRAAAKFAGQWALARKPNSLDKPVAELPHIQDKAGRMELALLAAENTLFKVAGLASNSEFARQKPLELQALIGAAKNLATNNAIEAIDYALRIVGGAGLSMELPLQRNYRDARAGIANPPMDDISIGTLGKLALGLTRDLPVED